MIGFQPYRIKTEFSARYVRPEADLVRQRAEIQRINEFDVEKRPPWIIPPANNAKSKPEMTDFF
jgi:hypothetical protein